jgi:hypothetical protein
MRRRIIMALLALGAIGGYGAGFAHMHRACHNEQQWHGHADCADQHTDSR